MKRTPEEITSQVKGLQNEKKTLPEFDFFGENNWEKIDEQIDIITSKKIYDADEYENPDLESAAYDANEWLNGDRKEDLFETE